MKKMVISWIFLMSVLFVAILYFGYSFIASIAEYQTLESDMVEAADFYVTLNEINLSSGKSIKIESDKLIESKTLNSMDLEDDKCVGYVEIKKNIAKYDYKAYIKCENYTTDGYEE